MTQLEEGQLPNDELARARTAHEVRTLRLCPVCRLPGNDHCMVDIDGEWFHGRCFAERFGENALGALPKAKSDRLTLGDLGVRLMRKLVHHRTRTR